MRFRQLAAGTAAAMMIAGGVSLVAAPAATADTINISTNCDAAIPLTANVGDTIIFTMGPGCGSGTSHWAMWSNRLAEVTGNLRAPGWLHILSESGAASGVFDGGGGTDTVWVQAGAVLTTELLGETTDGEPLYVGAQTSTIWDQSTIPTFNFYAITYAGPRDNYVPPPSWDQAVGRASADATCPDGWNPSWAEWPNGGAGGWVCQRQEYYNVSTATWAFRAKASIGR